MKKGSVIFFYVYRYNLEKFDIIIYIRLRVRENKRNK